MLPTSSSSRASSDPGRPDGDPGEETQLNEAEPNESPAPKGQGKEAPLGPIGPERLAALREAIQNGTYPAKSDVVGGLVRMFCDPRA